jgi:hypothetical protein
MEWRADVCLPIHDADHIHGTHFVVSVLSTNTINTITITAPSSLDAFPRPVTTYEFNMVHIITFCDSLVTLSHQCIPSCSFRSLALTALSLSLSLSHLNGLTPSSLSLHQMRKLSTISVSTSHELSTLCGSCLLNDCR